MDNNLIGYLLNALDPDEHRRTEEYLRDNADARRKLEILRVALTPLSVDRAQPEPPTGLVERTMACLSGAFVRTPRARVAVAGSEPVYAPSRWRRVDVLVACCILVVLGGLGTSGLAHLHQSRERAICQNNMREFYQGFDGYAQVRNGAFPFISDSPPRNHAGAFQEILVDSGQMSPSVKINCPVAPANLPGTSYAYTLGYRDREGGLHGLRRGGADIEGDAMPLLADQPRIVAHSPGFNVLFINGAVRFTTNRNIGVNADDIFTNDDGVVKAGLHSRDSVLGPSDTSP
jgi:hypothetical protein